ncbi:Protein kinase C signaling pathway involved MAPKK protein, partial [Linderina macrospora]
MSLNRSNATSNRHVRPAVRRLYIPTTPRGQPPAAVPRLNIPISRAPPNLPQLAIDPQPTTTSDAKTATTALPYPDVAQYIANGGGQQDVAAVASRLTTLTVTDVPTPPEDTEEYDLKVANIKVLKKLGEGSVGTVHKVEYLPTKKIMARKLMAVYPDETNHRQIIRELKLLKQCRSPYIVTFFGAYFSDDDDGQSIAICMEYCEGGSLEAVYKRVQSMNGHIGEGVLGKVAVAVLNGLVNLYKAKVIHRDVKPSNILVTGRGEIKLCDFGVSGELVDSIAQTFVGTSYYMAPERIK